uniref:Hypothetical secreted peptide n=1 Tax=Glossina morsitans morsitans TaxID=37546 RepID=D3TSQ9_GLOMM
MYIFASRSLFFFFFFLSFFSPLNICYWKLINFKYIYIQIYVQCIRNSVCNNIVVVVVFRLKSLRTFQIKKSEIKPQHNNKL